MTNKVKRPAKKAAAKRKPTVDYRRRKDGDAWVWDFDVLDAKGEVTGGGYGHPSKAQAKQAAEVKLTR